MSINEVYAEYEVLGDRLTRAQSELADAIADKDPDGDARYLGDRVYEAGERLREFEMKHDL